MVEYGFGSDWQAVMLAIPAWLANSLGGAEIAQMAVSIVVA